MTNASLSDFGWEWHSDTSHLETPSLGSILYAKIVPPMGGDTLFANQYIAYEALSQGMKAVLDGLVAVHANGRILRTLSEAEPPPPGSESASAAWSDMSAKHPVVHTHPETGRKALYVNDYQGHHRLMHRVQVKGDRPVSPLTSKTSSIVFDPRLL